MRFSYKLRLDYDPFDVDPFGVAGKCEADLRPVCFQGLQGLRLCLLYTLTAASAHLEFSDIYIAQMPAVKAQSKQRRSPWRP